MKHLHIIFVIILACIVCYAIYVVTSRESQNKNYISYLEDYYSSMMPPQVNTEKLFIWFTGLNLSVFNSVTHFYYTTHIGDRVDEILAQAPEGKPISFWVNALQKSDQLVYELNKRGFQKVVTTPFMTWTVTAIEQPAYTVKRINEDTAGIFYTIIAKVFGLDDETRGGLQHLFSQSLAENYLVYLDDKPVGTGTLFIKGNVGFILNIGVLPEYQKRGCGAAISQFLMHRAYELNLEKVILNASPVALNMYKNLGFTEEYDLDIYAK